MKRFWNTHKTHIAAACVILLILALAFWWGGRIPKEDAPETEKTQSEALSLSAVSAEDTPTEEVSATETATESATEEAVSPAPATEAPQMKIDPATGQDQYHTDPVPAGAPQPVEPQTAEKTDEVLTCTLSIRCDTALLHKSALSPEKAAILPADGVILPPEKVTFYEGESVFHVLQRETKRHKIHMEFVNTPIYNSAYIEGIGNLYEFDCGELSGWMYKVNGWFPNYGCSRYQLHAGDSIEWVYTCDLGKDVGDNSNSRNGR